MPAPLPPAARAREELVANLMAIPAALGLILAVIAFFHRGSGISGTPGAGLAILGMAALTVAALLVGRLAPGRLRTFVTVMILIGGLLTLLCAWFLMQGWIMLMIVLTLALWLVFILVAR
ncbi:hypothetical protein FA743_06275 [Paracoccus gahaiensis]|uniref:Uncharacterized protein n=1 Tax=Paracoccus gahaiensis TaxID=1706839 RepID=A0A4U0RVU4_9RHOB|nr:hypothetical protein [Paracoccus gahaiensis]TJZ92474.1 hypothetical protein FA743_06275 [Paracoccus gahaiensis]